MFREKRGEKNNIFVQIGKPVKSIIKKSVVIRGDKSIDNKRLLRQLKQGIIKQIIQRTGRNL